MLHASKPLKLLRRKGFNGSLQSVNRIPKRVKITPLRPGAGRCLAALGDSKTPPESHSHNQPTKRVKTNCFKKLQNSTTAPCLQPCKALRGSSPVSLINISSSKGAAAPGAGAVRQRESMGGASASPIIFLLRRSAAELHMSSPSPVFVRGGCNLLIARAERRAQK